MASPSPEVTLRIETPSQSQTVSLDDLQKQFKPETLKVYNQVYKREMTYQGFWLEQVLKIAHFPKGPDVIFICRDGYTALLPAALIGKHQWLLAYREASGSWTPLDQGGQQVSPAPWYLVSAKKASFADFPWPYQIIAIRSLRE